MKSWQIVAEVFAERVRQQEVEGYNEHHDKRYKAGELERAASAYALEDCKGWVPEVTGNLWPWDFRFWKPKSRRQNLIRACALLVAAIERVDREEELKAHKKFMREQERENESKTGYTG